MKEKKLSLEKIMNIELLKDKEFIEINGGDEGATSISYDIATLFRATFQVAGQNIVGATSTISMWFWYQ